MLKLWPSIIITLIIIMVGEIASNGSYSIYHIIILIVVWAVNVFFLTKTIFNTPKNIEDDKGSEPFNTLIVESAVSSKLMVNELGDVIGNISRLKEVVSDAVPALFSSFTFLSEQTKEQDDIVNEIVDALDADNEIDSDGNRTLIKETREILSYFVETVTEVSK